VSRAHGTEPEANVPMAVMFAVPAQVESAVFLTLPRPTLLLLMASHEGSLYEPVVYTPAETVAALPEIATSVATAIGRATAARLQRPVRNCAA
jgi:hypothetical protein